MRRKRRPQVVDQFENGTHRGGKHDQVAVPNGIRRIGMSLVDGAALARPLKLERPVATHNQTMESIFLERERERSADQSGADDGDLADGHSFRRSCARLRERSCAIRPLIARTAGDIATAPRPTKLCPDRDALRSTAHRRQPPPTRGPLAELCHGARFRATDRRSSANAKACGSSEWPKYQACSAWKSRKCGSRAHKE